MAVCSILAAICVLVAQIGLSGYPRPASTEENIALYALPVFRAQSWTILIQVFLMFLAIWGVAVKMHQRAPALITTGFLFFVFWQLFEMIPRSIDLFAASYNWAPSYLAAKDEAIRSTMTENFRVFGDVSDAIQEVRRVMWALGHLLFGFSSLARGRMEEDCFGIFLT